MPYFDEKKLYDKPRVRKSFSGQGRTHQEFQSEVKIGNIVRKYRTTGQITNVNPQQPWYGDFSEGMDFQQCLERIEAAEEAFMGLPHEVRSLCNNDVALFVDMLQTEEGVADLVDAGMPIDQPESGAPTDKVEPGEEVHGRLAPEVGQVATPPPASEPS